LRSIYVLITAALALLPMARPAIAGVDPVSTTFQVDPAHDGSVTFSKRFAPPLKRRWSLDLGGPVSYPVVAGNLAIVIVGGGSIGTHLVAVDIDTGKVIWQKPVSVTLGASYLASDNGKVFLTTFQGPIQAYNATTGRLLWGEGKPQFLYQFDFVPVAAGGYLFTGETESGTTLYKLNETNGRLIWQKGLNGGGKGVTLADSLVVLPMLCNVPAFDQNSGLQIWYFYSGCSGGGGAVAAYYKHRLYAPQAGGETGLILNTGNGKQSGVLPGSAPAFYGDTLFAVSGESIAASNIFTDNLTWFYTPKDDGFSIPPIVINGNVYSLSNKGVLHVNARLDGRSEQTITLGLGSQETIIGAPWTGLGVGSGILLVPSGTGLFAFGPS